MSNWRTNRCKYSAVGSVDSGILVKNEPQHDIDSNREPHYESISDSSIHYESVPDAAPQYNNLREHEAHYHIPQREVANVAAGSGANELLVDEYLSPTPVAPTYDGLVHRVNQLELDLALANVDKELRILQIVTLTQDRISAEAQAQIETIKAVTEAIVTTKVEAANLLVKVANEKVAIMEKKMAIMQQKMEIMQKKAMVRP